MLRALVQPWRFRRHLARIERRYVKLGALDDPRERAALQQIREEGYFVWPGFYSGTDLERLQDEADRLLRGGQGAQYEQDNVRIAQVRERSPEIDRLFAAHPLFARIARAYYDAPVEPFHTIVQESRPLTDPETPIAFGLSGFHFDGLRRTLKIFVYVEDCELANGPFTIVPRSSGVDGFDKRRKLFECFDGGGEPATYYSDEEAKRLDLERLALPVTGEAGTVFFADTRSLHKGSTVQSGRRRVLVNYYKA